MKKLLEFIITQLITKPEDLRIEEINEGGEHQYIIHVNSEDMGLVIGKDGKTIQSIRELAIAKAVKENIKVRVVLAEEGEPLK